MPTRIRYTYSTLNYEFKKANKESSLNLLNSLVANYELFFLQHLIVNIDLKNSFKLKRTMGSDSLMRGMNTMVNIRIFSFLVPRI